MVRSFEKKVALITGGSAGIGFAVASELVSRGAVVVLLARNAATLAEARLRLLALAGDRRVDVVAADVADRTQVAAALEVVTSRYGRIDYVVNNAGVMQCNTLSGLTWEELDVCYRTNYLGAVNVTKLAWPHLAASGGHVSFVGSVAGYMGLFGYAAYAPGKFALTGLAECVRMEGRKDGIGVSIAFPADVRTAMYDYEQRNALPETLAITGNVRPVEPSRVATALVDGIAKDRFEIFCNRSGYWYRLLKAVMPRVFYRTLDRMAAPARQSARAAA